MLIAYFTLIAQLCEATLTTFVIYATLKWTFVIVIVIIAFYYNRTVSELKALQIECLNDKHPVM